MIVTSYREGEATLDLSINGLGIRILQCATGKHSLLGVVKRNMSKLLPVANQLIFHNDFVDSKLALALASDVSQPTGTVF